MQPKQFIRIGLVVALLAAGVLLLSRPGALTPESPAHRQSLLEILMPGSAGANVFNDPDIMPGAEGLISENEYLELRDEHLARLHGISAEMPVNARAQAVLVMQQQETALGPANLGPGWIELGPAPLPNGQTSGPPSPVSGRTIAIAIHPTNPDIAYVGTAQGGLYRTLDGGVSWTPLMDNALSLAIGAVALDPNNASTLFVGTGEPNGSADSAFGVGLYVITNADTTATLNGPFNLDGGGANVLSGRSISKIVVNPNDSNMIFLGTYSGCNSIGCVWPSGRPPAGLFRSTNALSASPTFTKLTVATDNGGDNRVSDLVLEPGNPDNLIVGVRASIGTVGGGIYRSTNATSGSPNFTRVLGLDDVRIELAINKVSTTVTVLAATGEAGNSGVLRRSTDGGATWPDVLPGANGFCNPQCWYDIAVDMDPNDANIIHLGGAASRPMQRSTDGGATFVNVSSTMHADTHAAAVAPSDSSVVYVGSDGGIWRSDDNGASYTSLNNTDFKATQFQDLALHPTHPTFMIGGTQDNGTPCFGVCGVGNDDPDAWIRADWGDGGYAIIDQNAVNTKQVLMYHTYYNVVGYMLYARVTHTDNARDSGWRPYGCGGSPNGFDCTDLVNFYAPMAQGPGNPNTLYFGSDTLYRSDDGGLNMADVSGGTVDPGAGSNGRITTIAISPQNDNVRLIGLRNGKVFATTTGSSPLVDVTPAGAPATWVGRAFIDPNNSNTAYIAYAGYDIPAGQSVWKTTNLAGGAGTWVASSSGIPDVAISAFAVDPNDSNTLFAGTDIGVYRSTDGGANWAPFGTGLPRVAVFDMAIHNIARKLRIATHGRGIWEIDLGGAVPNINQLDKRTMDDGTPAPGEPITYTIQFTNTGGAAGTAVVTDTFPLLGVATPTCVGYDAAAGYNQSGDLFDTVLIPEFDRATYHCATSLDGPVLAVTTEVDQSSINGGDSVTYTITITNSGPLNLRNVTIADPDIPFANCDQDPAGPFKLLPGETKSFVCSNVVVNSTTTNTTVANGTMVVTNTATVSGTTAILVDVEVVNALASDSDQATVTATNTLYMPVISSDAGSKSSAVVPEQPAFLAGWLPFAGLGLWTLGRRFWKRP